MPIKSQRPSSTLESAPANQPPADFSKNIKASHNNHSVSSQTGVKHIPAPDSPTGQFLEKLKHIRAVRALPKMSAQNPPSKPADSSGKLTLYWNSGHASILLSKGGQTVAASGFHPKEYVNGEIKGKVLTENYLDQAIAAGSPVLNLDLNQEQFLGVVWSLTDLDIKCAMGSPECSYNLLTNNCLDFAQRIYKSTGKDGHWLDHFSAKDLSREPGVRSAFLALAAKPYHFGETLPGRLGIWAEARYETFQEDSVLDVHRNFNLLAASVPVVAVGYHLVKWTFRLMGRLIYQDPDNEKYKDLDPAALKFCAEKSLASVEQLRKGVDRLIDYSGDDNLHVMKQEREKVLEESIELAERLDTLIKRLGAASTNPELLARLLEDIDTFCGDYRDLCKRINENPLSILGVEIRGNIDRTRQSITTVLNYLNS